MDEVDLTVLAAKSVFTDMIDKCPPAETCRDAFDRTARATIKMASSNGGFGSPVQPPRRPRTQSSTVWGSAVDSTTPTPQTQRRNRTQDGQPFNFDLSLSDTLSSPTLSVTNERVKPSPPLSTAKSYETDYMMASSQGARSPAGVNVKQEPSSGPSGPPRRRMTSQPSSAGGNTFMGQQFGLQGAMDYPDMQTMDFLQNLGATPNGGEFGSVDQNQVDLGFGMNWEGLPNEYGDNQQMNPFDTFFFGGQQGGAGGNGPNGGMGL